MPLNGFRIVDWAVQTFGGMPPAVLGGFGVAVLVAGIVLAVIGFKLTPVSYGLVAAGFGLAIITYFIVGAAIAGASSTIQGTETVASRAPQTVPYAAATVCFGLAMFGGRLTLRLWSDEETSGKVMAGLVAIGVLLLLFVGIQLMRGGMAAPAPSETTPSDENAVPAGDDEPIRRGVGVPRHRE